ncbi:MAG TPA: MarR family winged helix-turn-helix transcriptional regulator [Propioniciclava sp.]|jgi:DNA-binding MarR family transcriptional regulator|uniref:MarR family winged helix-turn-helix transcriptional regulator n=1 Tax=Propioniciclava sp. TaxID=2038686 RepID=UPI002BB4D54F|nr:MarR family winged helix-turn-helix transcriptional regulator [Propioniciclava sp.]HRL48310.1 MarR family winged helix-turn-helix transcriptional regulator [Propioniciclava sp.]HRL78913.1 MarR family winged helix-turn-helix transcriptional regulator [Propioniciclava sp.]
MAEVRWLNDGEIEAWLKFRAVIEVFPGVLDSQLRRDENLTHMEYQVLAMLSEVPEATLRMSALAARSNATLTRMSHVVTRMSVRGLVERLACVKDGRATNVHLTATGRDALVAAAPGHVAQVRASLIDAVTPEQLQQLGDICDAILDRIDPDGVVTSR